MDELKVKNFIRKWCNPSLAGRLALSQDNRENEINEFNKELDECFEEVRY